MRKFAIAGALLALSAVAALAIQPGTTGTEKRYQNQGLRSAVLLQRNRTATAVAGAATLNQAGSGVITTEALTTAPASDYTLTLTNNMIAAADIVLASVRYGTATLGQPYIKRVQEGSGTVVIVVGNSNENSVAPFNGTLQIKFLVVKQNADGSD